ncbi:hypothetical protein ABIE67_008193 [Streptomyces sp. V4I8]
MFVLGTGTATSGVTFWIRPPSPRRARSPEGLDRLPSAAAAPIVDAYADTLQTVFLWTVPVAALGFVAALFLKQVPLRDSARRASTDMGRLRVTARCQRPAGAGGVRRQDHRPRRPRDASLLSHIPAGAREAQVIGKAWAAVHTIAKRLLGEDLSDGLPRRAKEPALSQR